MHKLFVLVILMAGECSAQTEYENMEMLKKFTTQNKRIHTLRDVVENDNNIWRQLSQVDGLELSHHMIEEVKTRKKENSTIISAVCVEHVLYFFESLSRGDLWALGMLDAVGKPSSGILTGNFAWWGNFNQCRNITAHPGVDANLDNFKGKYCFETFMTFPSENETAEVEKASVQTLENIPMSFGLCLPDSCDNSDAAILVNIALSLVANNTAVIDSYCQPEHVALDAPAIGVICMLSVIGLFVVLGTLYDIASQQYYKQNITIQNKISNGDTQAYNTGPKHSGDTAVRGKCINVICQVLLSFSAYTNGAKILDTKKTEGSLPALHGIRFITMSWIILGHGIAAMSNVIESPVDALRVIRRWTFQAIANAQVSVDTFFFLSGFLVSYLTLNELHRRKGRLNWLLFYVHRYIRLTPPYMLVLGTYVALFKYWGDGPMWPSDEGMDPNCKENWWTNLLYVNNLVRTNKLCMGMAWYLANDMQFYLISPLMLYPLYRKERIGQLICFILLAISIVTTAVISKTKQLMAFALDHFRNDPRTDGWLYFNEYYIVPWCRIGPYIVGVVFGYVLQKTKGKLRINWAIVGVCWIAATVVALAILYGPFDPKLTQPYNVDLNALYNSTARTVWAICVGWVVFACLNGYGGFVNTILSWDAWVPLSRLTYMAYLTHGVIQTAITFSQKKPFFADNKTAIYYFFGHLLLTYLVSFVLSLSFESPTMRLEKLLLGGKIRPKVEKDGTQASDHQSTTQVVSARRKEGDFNISVITKL